MTNYVPVRSMYLQYNRYASQRLIDLCIIIVEIKEHARADHTPGLPLQSMKSSQKSSMNYESRYVGRDPRLVKRRLGA